MPKLVTVQRMPHTITFEGKNYGPSSTPLQVPEELAAALGLPVTSAQAIQTAQQQNADQDLQASRQLAGQYQEQFEKLQTLLQPHMGQGATPEQALQGIVNERDEARGVGQALERLQLQAENDLVAAKKELADLQTKLADAEDANLEYLEYVGELLPQDFPERKLLLTDGYITVAHVQAATDEELKAIDGIADKRLEAIRKVAPYTPVEETPEGG